MRLVATAYPRIPLRLVVEHLHGDDLGAVVEDRPGAPHGLHFERENPRLRIEEIADPLGPVVPGAAAGGEKASAYGVAVRQRDDRVGTALLERKLGRG
jgi:hypothetical protein